MPSNKCYFFIALLLIASASVAQNAYTDSLISYQYKYKSDLVPIIKSDTAFVKFYTVNPAYQVAATVEKLQEQKFFNMPTTGNNPHEAITYAIVKFKLQGKEYTLHAYQLAFLLTDPKQKDHFFIPFTDQTSGEGSYTGGRYMDFTVNDIRADGTLQIDFNRAYNPYCAFSAGYNCPIPPKENDLPVKILAGEKEFTKKK